MKDKHTKLIYFCSKDPMVLSLFFSKQLPFKVEIKNQYYAKGKHWVWCNLPDHKAYDKVKFKNIDLDEL